MIAPPDSSILARPTASSSGLLPRVTERPLRQRERALHERVEAERREVTFVEDDRVALRDRLKTLRSRELGLTGLSTSR